MPMEKSINVDEKFQNLGIAKNAINYAKINGQNTVIIDTAGRLAIDEQMMQDLMALQGVSKYPVRVKCAVLAWDTLQKALKLK